MKKIFLFLILGIFMLSLVSAFDWNDNTQSYYKLDESSGPVIDAVSANNARNNGATTGVAGKINTAYDFEFTDTDYVANSFASISDQDFSISLWAKLESKDVADFAFAYGKNGDVDTIGYIFQESNEWKFRMQDDSGAGLTTVAGGATVIGTWYNLISTYNHSTKNMTLYVNGVNVDSATFGGGTFTYNNATIGAFLNTGTGVYSNTLDAVIDEVGTFTRTLSDSEVSEIYAGGAGLPFTLAGITLEFPEDGSTLSANVTFNATISPSAGFNLTNATLVIWDSLGSIFTSETNSLSGNITTLTNFSVINLSSGDYTWNIFSIESNVTIDQEILNATNRTFTWIPFTINNIIFENFVLETDDQDFDLVITTSPDILSVEALLIYDDETFQSDVSCSAGFCLISNNMDIPLVSSGESENKSFFWTIIAFDGTTSFEVNTSSLQQNVTRIHLEKCDGTFTDQSLGFTAFDESNLSAVDPFKFDGDFSIWLGQGSISRQSNFSESSVSSLDLCITPDDRQIKVQGIIEYDEATGSLYNPRNYFFDNDTINTTKQDIGLGLLLSDISTTFILQAQDTDILPFPGVLIYTERFYPGTSTFRVVQVGRTDDDGQSIGFFKTETVDYRFVLKINGTTVLTTGIRKIVGTSVPFTLTFTIGEDEGSAWEVFESPDDLDFTNDFNKSSSEYTFTYADTSAQFTSSALEIYKVNGTGDDPLICNVTSVQSSASISCNLTGNSSGQYIAKGVIFRNGVRSLVFQEQFNIQSFSDVAGQLGLFLGWFIILVSAFAFRFNEIAGIFMVNIAMIFVNVIGLVSFGPVFISAMIAISILIGVILER